VPGFRGEWGDRSDLFSVGAAVVLRCGGRAGEEDEQWLELTCGRVLRGCRQ